MNTLIETILTSWVPYGLGIIGIIVFIIGVFKLIGNKDGAFSNMLSGIVIVAIAIAMKYVLEIFVLPALAFSVFLT